MPENKSTEEMLQEIAEGNLETMEFLVAVNMASDQGLYLAGLRRDLAAAAGDIRHHQGLSDQKGWEDSCFLTSNRSKSYG